MARILLATEGSWISHVSRVLLVGMALARAGHSVEFACSGRHTGLIDQAGFRRYEMFTKPPDFGLAHARRRGSSYDREIVSKYVEAELACFDAVRPDLVLGDFRLTLGLSAEARKIPFVAVLNGYWTHYYAAAHTAPESLALVSLVGTKLASRFFRPLRNRFLKAAEHPFNEQRVKLGLHRKGDLFEEMASDTLNLIVDLPAFTPLKDAPERFRFVGPIVWEPEVPLPEWFPHLERDRPILYVTLGSTGNAGVLAQVVDQYRDTEYQVVVSGLAALPGRASPNVFVAPLLPGLRILEVADVIVCHGGNGTIYQALSKGVPVIGIPTMHDQWFNMERVEALQAGVMLSEKRFSAPALRRAVERVLTDPVIRDGAAALQGAIAATDAPSTAARLIDDLLRTGRL
jgi:MGT family glycosyltransferase